MNDSGGDIRSMPNPFNPTIEPPRCHHTTSQETFASELSFAWDLIRAARQERDHLERANKVLLKGMKIVEAEQAKATDRAKAAEKRLAELVRDHSPSAHGTWMDEARYNKDRWRECETHLSEAFARLARVRAMCEESYPLHAGGWVREEKIRAVIDPPFAAVVTP